MGCGSWTISPRASSRCSAVWRLMYGISGFPWSCARRRMCRLGPRRRAQLQGNPLIPYISPSSNVQTGAAPSIAEHPIGLLSELRFRVTVNTDNRLMSGTSLSREMALLVEAFGYGWADLQWLTINAMKSAFIPFDERLALINEVIKPAYAK